MKNILLVDDESSLIMSMADGLESQGDQYRVYTATNGKEAVETLETKPVDLVVTDLRMPEMDGFELLAYINDNRPSTPTIVMSAFATPRIEDKLKELGALQVLAKPLDFERLSEAINQGLNHVFQGGSLAGISVGSFLQLMEAEQKTSLLEVLSEDKQKGFFYLDEGQLHDAVCGDKQGEDAAIEMLTWKGAQIRFRSLPEKKLKKNIHQGLMSLLMEASHLEDERAGAEAGPPEESLGGPDDLSLGDFESGGSGESVLSDDLSMDEELGEEDVVSGDLGAEDVDWLVEDLAPEDDASVVEKVPGAEEKDLFEGVEEQEGAIPEDAVEQEAGSGQPAFTVEEVEDDSPLMASDPSFEDDGDLFAGDDLPGDEGDPGVMDSSMDGLFEVEEVDDDSGDLFSVEEEPQEGGLFDVEEVEDDSGDLFAEAAPEGGGLFDVEEEPESEGGLFDVEEVDDDSGDLLAEEAPEGGGLFDVEEEPESEGGLFDVEEVDDDSGDLYAEEAPEGGGLFDVEEEPAQAEEAAFDVGEMDAPSQPEAEIAPEEAGDDLEFESAEADDDGLFDIEEMDPGSLDVSDLEAAEEEMADSFDMDEDELGDDGLPDLDMELPDEVPPPPPITAAAPRAIPAMAKAASDKPADTEEEPPQEAPAASAPGTKISEDLAEKLRGVLKSMADEIEGVKVCAVCGMDGIGLAEHNPKGVDTQAFGGKFAVVMQLIGKSAQDLHIGQFQENLVQTENAWVLTRFLTPEYYLVITIGRESTLGNVRLVVAKYSSDLDGIFAP